MIKITIPVISALALIACNDTTESENVASTPEAKTGAAQTGDASSSADSRKSSGCSNSVSSTDRFTVLDVPTGADRNEVEEALRCRGDFLYARYDSGSQGYYGFQGGGPANMVVNEYTFGEECAGEEAGCSTLLSGSMRGTRVRMQGSARALYSGVEDEAKLVQISSGRGFKDEEAPLGSAVVDALIEKYGEASLTSENYTGGKVLMWIWDEDGRMIAQPSDDRFIRWENCSKLINPRNPQLGNVPCSKALTAVVNVNDAGVAQGVNLVLTDKELFLRMRDQNARSNQALKDEAASNEAARAADNEVPEF